jgi:hypothetical protein
VVQTRTLRIRKQTANNCLYIKAWYAYKLDIPFLIACSTLFNSHFISKINEWGACKLECVLQTDKPKYSSMGHASLSVSFPNIPLQSSNHYFQRNVGSDNMRFALLQLRYGWGLKVGVCYQNFKYWLSCFIVSCWFFLLTHSSQWKINQVLHPMRWHRFVASEGVGLPSSALIFICFQFLDTDVIEHFSTGSKLEWKPKVGRKEEYAWSSDYGALHLASFSVWTCSSTSVNHKINREGVVNNDFRPQAK